VTQASRVAGSFRDPSGYVYRSGDTILRTVRQPAVQDYDFVKTSGVLRELQNKGWLIESEETDDIGLVPPDEAVKYVIKHPLLPFISYPYEWPFGALQAAGLLQLDIHLAALARGVTLSDASAYNVQFRGSAPLFIDLLSLRRYREGEYWDGHRQFCEQFLNPLLLQAEMGVSFHSWYRGSLEGIPVSDLAKLLPLRRRLSPRLLAHVVLQAKLQSRALGKAPQARSPRPLPVSAFRAMLGQLRGWVASLKPRFPRRSTWSHYETETTYSDTEHQAKRAFVTEFAQDVRPHLLWDLGCNTGEYSETALAAGATSVVGFDADDVAIEKAYARGVSRGLSFLPLRVDVANPSPNQGWREEERSGLASRGPADGVLALAVIHHLAIGRNVPLCDVVDWLVGLAPTGVIEFVHKDDPTVRTMLALREDIFPDYDPQVFESSLRGVARIVRQSTISGTGRTLYHYDRR
jgi:ribosomal protein L11 methylase PrmA